MLGSHLQTKQDEQMKKLRYLFLIVPILMITMLTIMYRKAYHQPYNVSISQDSIPQFTEVPFAFQHQFNKNKSLPFTGSGIIDSDNLGAPEVFVGGGYNQEDSLFRYENNEFVEITDHGINKDLPDTTLGMAAVDVNNDGLSDLFIARDSGVHLYTNSGGKFTGKKLDIPLNEKSTPLSFALADLNKDGYIDMYVSTYLNLEDMEGQNIFNKEGYGSTSLLLLNNGDNTFTDITKKAGVHYVHNTFQGIFIDVDGDELLDLVVAHDTGHVKTWKNLGNLTFSDIPNPTSPPVYGYPMGIGLGDYNNDSKPDFFFSNTGGTAPHFMAKGDLREGQVFNDKLIFFRNDGDFKFTNVNHETKTADYEFSWGVVLEDLNLDGLQDIIISQNYVAFPPHKLFRLPGRVLIQKPDHTFVATEEQSGVVNRNYEITSLVSDFNMDGYPDLVRVNLNGPVRAFINNGGDANYLKVKLPHHPRSFGAIVQVELTDGSVLTDYCVTGEGLSSDQGRVLTFGLGEKKNITKVFVKFADGSEKNIAAPQPNTMVVLS